MGSLEKHLKSRAKGTKRALKDFTGTVLQLLGAVIFNPCLSINTINVHFTYFIIFAFIFR